MCLSTVRAAQDPERVIMEYVSKIRIEDDQITLTDVMGEEMTVRGYLKLADLTGAIVQIELED